MANDQDPVRLNGFYEVLRTSLGKAFGFRWGQ